MFRPMRRANQALSAEECKSILERATSGVLALHGDDGYPYAVPVSFVYADGKLYFHGAEQGHRPDAVRRDPKASFCIIDADEVQPEDYTTRFRSVILFGKIRILEDKPAKWAALELLTRKFAPQHSEERRQAQIELEYPGTCVMEFTIEHMTGKKSRAA